MIAEIVQVAGSVALIVGATLAWRPAGWIVGGGLLLVWGVWLEAVRMSRKREKNGSTTTAG